MPFTVVVKVLPPEFVVKELMIEATLELMPLTSTLKRFAEEEATAEVMTLLVATTPFTVEVRVFPPVVTVLVVRELRLVVPTTPLAFVWSMPPVAFVIARLLVVAFVVVRLVKKPESDETRDAMRVPVERFVLVVVPRTVRDPVTEVVARVAEVVAKSAPKVPLPAVRFESARDCPLRRERMLVVAS